MAQSGQVSGPIVAGHWGTFEWLLLLAPAIAILVAIYVWRKSGRMAGEHVFRASRVTRGNRLFPAQVVITPTSITLFKPQWIGKMEESIHMAHVASIKIDTGVMFADVFIETSSGRDPIICHGHTKGDVVAMKKLIEEFQSAYYRSKVGV